MSSVASLAPVAVVLGSDQHRHLLADFFIASHADFSPEAIRWPELDAATRARLARLPFWQEAVSTEAATARTVSAAAALEPDAELARAIELQGFEEQRHARLLALLTRHFGIPVQVPQLPASRSLEHDFLFAGFGECFDSFFAFGLFEIARRSGYFPAELIRIFEPIVQEEARHILFFVNWVRYRRQRMPWWRRPLFRLRCGGIILQQVASRVRTARSMNETPQTQQPTAPSSGNAENFTLSAHQDLGDSVGLRELLEECLRENERRLGQYDARLARPRLVPRLVGAVVRVLSLLPTRKPAGAPP
jgi:hypothetical protein